MPKYMIGIVSFLLLGCASNSVTNNTLSTAQNSASVANNDLSVSQPKPKANIEPTTIYEMLVQAKEYQEKEKNGDLSSKEEEKWNSWKNKYSAGDGEYTHKITGKKLSMAEVVTMSWAIENEFSWEEIDWVLDLGIYKDNPYCEKDIKAVKIISVLANDSALVYACPYTTNTEGCDPSDIKIFVYASQDPEELLYDKKKIVVPEGACAMMFATTTYNTASGERATVPAISFINDRLHNKRLEQLKKSRADMPHIDLRTGEVTYRRK